MDKQIEKALNASLHEYGQASNQPIEAFQERVMDAFNANRIYLEKVKLLDESFDDYPDFEELREVYFDLLLMNFFSVDVEKLEGDYLESEEWETIEEKTLERGTELLNLLLYLRECADEGIVPELNDYLKEFLLVEEDEFQDEHRIYEAMIENQALIDSTYAEIARISETLKPDSEIAEIFYPMMSFFNDNEPTERQFLEFIEHSKNKPFDAGVFALLIAFNQHG
jgi:hypothetical protein